MSFGRAKLFIAISAVLLLTTSCLKVDNSIHTNFTPSPEGGSSSPTISCPANFIAVPALAPYTTEDFCVAKYEMKIAGDDNGDQTYNAAWAAESRKSGTPWVKVTRFHAMAECQAFGSEYDLISGAEWQSIARNIEQVGWNWSNGTVGDAGGISRSIGMSSGIAASEDSDSCNGTGNSCDLSIWSATRRVHRLSNGNYIWDLAGNVGEWTKTNLGTQTGHAAISQINDASAKSFFGPAGNYLALNAAPFGGLGEVIDPGFKYSAVIRGGAWGAGNIDSNNAGVFAVSLHNKSDESDASIGFRCAFHPTIPLNQTLYSPDTFPAKPVEADLSDFEFGVTFQPSVNGFINGVRFYRAASNATGYTVNLWSDAGVNLATAAGSDGTIPGWQEISFASPVAVSAGTTYVASYYTSIGNYPAIAFDFTASWRGMPYLTALANGGVYKAGPGFPTSTFNYNSYLVDISFTASP